MSKRRLSSASRKTTRRRLPSRAAGNDKRQNKSKNKVSQIPCQRYIGVSLLGGKSDRTCVAVLEYFPKHGKVFLHQLFEKVQGTSQTSADTELIRIISEFAPNIELVAFDVPLQLPKCMRCNLACPGGEECKVVEVAYMRDLHKKTMKENKNAKFITPYTQRPVELYIQRKLERPYFLQDALGANLAPLTVRAQYILRRLKLPSVEVFPELSFARLGEQLQLPPKYMRQEARNFDQGDARLAFLNAILERRLCFIYQQDIQRLIDNADAFDAFLASFTAFLSGVGQCEDSPRGFPRGEMWIQFPVEKVNWSDFFKDVPLER